MNLNKNQCPDCVNYSYSGIYPVHYFTNSYETSADYHYNNFFTSIFSFGWKILVYLLKLFVILALLFTLITLILTARTITRSDMGQNFNKNRGIDKRYLCDYGANSYRYTSVSKPVKYGEFIKTCQNHPPSVVYPWQFYISLSSIINAITAVGVFFVSNNTIKAIINYSNANSFGAYFTSIAKGIIFDAKLIVIRTWDNIHILINRMTSLSHGIKYDPAQYQYTSTLKSYDDAKAEYEAAKHQWMNSMKVDPKPVTLSTEVSTSSSIPDVKDKITSANSQNSLEQDDLKNDDDALSKAKAEPTADQLTITKLTTERDNLTEKQRDLQDKYDKYVTATHNYHAIKAQTMEIGIEHNSHFANINPDYIDYVAAFLIVLLAYNIIKVLRNTTFWVVSGVHSVIYRSIFNCYSSKNISTKTVYKPIKGKKRVFVVNKS